MPQTSRLHVPTRQVTLWRARMGFIFAVAGLAWLLVALHSVNRLTPRTLTLCSMVIASALVACLVLVRRAPRLPEPPITTHEAERVRRIVIAVNILEWVAVATAFTVLLLLHLPQYIPTAAGILVGLYLYPLANALRAPLHTVSATLLVGWNSFALALLPRDRQMSVGAAGTGCVLLASAVVTLGWALWCTRGAVSANNPLASADLLTR